jgi:hypothetical protein
MGFGVFLSIGRRMKKSHMGRGRWRGEERGLLFVHTLLA